MAVNIFKKKPAKKEPAKFEDTKNLEKLSIFVTIVGPGQAEAICKIFKVGGSSAQFIQRGQGTATKQLRDILGIEDNSKDIIISLVKKSSIPNFKKELRAFFAASSKNRGIGFSIPMTSIAGVTVYKFLANVL